MDIATAWNVAENRGDWTIAAGDLASEAGLRTAILISLATDRLAEPDDPIEPGEDPRGWWADAYDIDGTNDRIGSRLWLLRREKSTEATRRRAVLYAEEALEWLVADGIAEAVAVIAEYQGAQRETLAMQITLRRGAAGADVAAAWSLELAR